MISAASCINGENAHGSYVGSSSLVRENALHGIQVGECWLRRQSKKHLTIEIFQVNCLLFLTKQANSIKRKQAWTSAGDIVRFSMAAGLHREPSLLCTKASVFQCEMRRRLWATIMELELQASIARGMPSSLAGLSFDCSPPGNLNDEDFGEDSEHIPMPKPSDEYTATSFLYLSLRSLSLRVKLNSTINNHEPPLTYDHVLAESQKITDCLAEIPRWDEAKASPYDHPETMIPRFLLEIQLRQILIWLHGPFARQDKSSIQARYSRMACLDTAGTILNRHLTLLAGGSRVLHMLRNDVYLASLSICHNLFISAIPSGSLPLNLKLPY